MGMIRKFKYVGIETTTICNADCSCCPRKAQYNLPWATMPMNFFEKIIMDVYENHEVDGHIRFGGMGDVSCDKLLLERLRFMKKNTPTLRCAVGSNMEVWKPAYTDAIVCEELLTNMRFSILAYTPDASKTVYGDAAQTEKARRAIDHFIEVNDKAGNPVWTEVYTLIFDGAVGEVDKIKAQYWNAVDEFEVWRPHSWSNRYPDLRPIQEERAPYCVSVQAFDQILIGIHGDVIPCSMDINYSLSVGSMKTHTLEEIIGGEKCRKLRELNERGEIETSNTCKGCVFLNADVSDVMMESKTKNIRILRHIT